MTPEEILAQVHHQTGDYHLTEEQFAWVNALVEKAETQKGVFTVLITLLVKKIETPAQDIRLHKVEFEGGFSGRRYDTQFITPFMQKQFPRLAMAESGWLTRSLEQPYPYTLDYGGRISDKKVKQAFLEILHDVEIQGASAQDYLGMLFRLLQEQQANAVQLLGWQIPEQITIQQIIWLLNRHFQGQYHGSGAARLPVLAIYAIYEMLLESNSRYQDKILKPLQSHTTADRKSNSLGDIEVLNDDPSYFEVVEIKHNKSIDDQMLNLIFQKIQTIALPRYYILTTAVPETQTELQPHLEHIRQQHGCEVIVNGVLPTLKYYLRLLDDPTQFLNNYETLLMMDRDIKQTHLTAWAELKEQL